MALVTAPHRDRYPFLAPGQNNRSHDRTGGQTSIVEVVKAIERLEVWLVQGGRQLIITVACGQ